MSRESDVGLWENMGGMKLQKGLIMAISGLNQLLLVAYIQYPRKWGERLHSFKEFFVCFFEKHNRIFQLVLSFADMQLGPALQRRGIADLVLSESMVWNSFSSSSSFSVPSEKKAWNSSRDNLPSSADRYRKIEGGGGLLM